MLEYIWGVRFLSLDGNESAVSLYKLPALRCWQMATDCARMILEASATNCRIDVLADSQRGLGVIATPFAEAQLLCYRIQRPFQCGR